MKIRIITKHSCYQNHVFNDAMELNAGFYVEVPLGRMYFLKEEVEIIPSTNPKFKVGDYVRSMRETEPYYGYVISIIETKLIQKIVPSEKFGDEFIYVLYSVNKPIKTHGQCWLVLATAPNFENTAESFLMRD